MAPGLLVVCDTNQSRSNLVVSLEELQQLVIELKEPEPTPTPEEQTVADKFDKFSFRKCPLALQNGDNSVVGEQDHDVNVTEPPYELSNR